MTFNEALVLLKAGKPLRIKEWSPGNFLTINNTENGPLLVLYVDNGTGRVTWSPTQREILSDDWVEAPPPPPIKVNTAGMDLFRTGQDHD